MMKVLLLDNAGLVYRNNCFCCVEGTGKFASELVNLGAEITMFGQKMALETSVSVFDIKAHGIKIAGLWHKENKIWNYLRLYVNAVKYVRRSDFVYIFYPNSFRYLAFVCMLFGKPYGLYIRGDEGLDNKISKKIYKKAIVVLTVSQMFTNMVNIVTGRQIAETIRPMLCFNECDIVRDRVYSTKAKFEFLMLCRLQKEKGIIELLNALAEMKKDFDDRFHLTVVGNGDFLEASREESRRLGLENDVVFLGGVYNNEIKKDIYKKADIYILPTYNEGFPRTLYEAMIFGTPIITTFVGGIPALMIEGENCKRIEPRSVISIKEALAYAMNNYEDMGRMARNATELVAKVVDHNRPTHARQLYDKIKEYGK